MAEAIIVIQARVEDTERMEAFFRDLRARTAEADADQMPAQSEPTAGLSARSALPPEAPSEHAQHPVAHAEPAGTTENAQMLIPRDGSAAKANMLHVQTNST